MLFFVVLMVLLLSACLLSVEAMKNGLGKKRWFFSGLLLGPVVWPMLNVKKQMMLRKQIGCAIVFLKA
ncbi:hypothetical protein [Psychrosphaera aestuarii]|uniref:hypothetical protein n=1 Tax=Psychrosphaera aestuarii TaxID=1266052 RepID=UPI001B31F07D|nr:hypothetical protein [Psychrosphaera aestuarii]